MKILNTSLVLLSLTCFQAEAQTKTDIAFVASPDFNEYVDKVTRMPTMSTKAYTNWFSACDDYGKVWLARTQEGADFLGTGNSIEATGGLLNRLISCYYIDKLRYYNTPGTVWSATGVTNVFVRYMCYDAKTEPIPSSQEVVTNGNLFDSTMSPDLCKPRAEIFGDSELRPLRAEGSGANAGLSTKNYKVVVTHNKKTLPYIPVFLGQRFALNSGGHSHDSELRPLLKMPTSGITDVNGEFKFTITASEFSGVHGIAAQCKDCLSSAWSSAPAIQAIDVKVPSLVQFPPDTAVPTRYTLIGQTATHPDNHYFTKQAISSLRKVIYTLNAFGWQPVGVNDGSLITGGRFDIAAAWGGSHKEHRTGDEVDISFKLGTNTSLIKRAYDDICALYSVEMPTTVLWHDLPKTADYTPHHHLRLLGNYTLGSNAGAFAECSKDSVRKR